MDESRKYSGNSESSKASRALPIVTDTTSAPLVDLEISEVGARDVLDMRLRELQAEIAIVRARLQAIRHQAGTLSRDGIEWIDACAHEQLGTYPWLKLSGIALSAFMTGRLLRGLPFGLVALAARSLLAKTD